MFGGGSEGGEEGRASSLESGRAKWHTQRAQWFCWVVTEAAYKEIAHQRGPKGTASDKLRLAVLWLLAYDGMPSEAELHEMDAALKAAGADVAPLSYVRTLKRNNLTGAKTGGPGGPTAAAAAAGVDGGLLASQGHLLDWADKTFGQGLSSVTKGMKSLLSGTADVPRRWFQLPRRAVLQQQFQPSSRTAPMAAVLEALMEGRPNSEHEQYTLFDPKQPAGRATLDSARGPFKDAIVFVIGGGNYLEREQLVNWGAKQQPPRTILYGATDLLSGTEFLHQLGDLSHRSNPLTASLGAH
eukprot:364397-Chlamydomonas_euryale.AAC.9